MTHITALYAGILALIWMGLAYRVVKGRWKHKVNIGDGANEDMERRIRVHANATEYLPLALILLAMLELGGVGHLWLHGLGVVLVVARVLHAVGFSKSSGASFGRYWGTLLTWLVVTVMALANVVHFFI
ncbi:MAG: MAPEG family protein [Pseudomonadales bacterium]|jgi:uncharacterized membrane protein YecN with MAPEG domain